ncbi:MAG: 23S rRNA (pseudouridine(1915)-N(3))-methyltransferase RlmH [Thermoleophilia bacterium]|nr:23S rRNA (pseudouridine(1915)-N(3))-methyltransferase RlmH [Thermoleophilia bacterium]
MRASIVCIGRLSREYQEVWRHYESLLRPYLNLEVLEASESPLAQGGQQARAKEGAALLGLLRKGAFTVALDMRGQTFTSEGLSTLLATKKVDGQSHFQFVLGGASGLDRRVLDAADLCWSLSALTFPHQMARCIVAEQLYRALKIERGEPYHH